MPTSRKKYVKKKYLIMAKTVGGKSYPAYVTKKGLEQFKKTKTISSRNWLGWKY